MGVSISTVRRRMSDAGILIRDYYSTMTNSELDEIVRHVQQQYPMCGNRQMQSPEAGAWLNAAPVTSLDLRMDDHTVRSAVAIRLGFPTCLPDSCRLWH